MNRVVRTLAVILFLGAMAWAIAGVASADSDQPRPFKATSYEVVTSEGPAGDSGCPAFEVHIEGHGTGTHLGAFTVQRQHCFTPPDHPAFAGEVIHDGTYELTAANGDRLWGTYSGELQPTEFGDAGPVRGIISGPSTIDGGSGRFAGAQGDYQITGDYNLVTDEGDFVYEGWITY